MDPVFYRELFGRTREVGAFLKTSAAVARAIAEPVSAYSPPRRVLEVGAGTGALTRALLERLGPEDELVLCEINERFAEGLRRDFPSADVFRGDVEELPGAERFHVIVSSLPFMNFEPEKVARILRSYEQRLEPRGTISSFDYWANGVRVHLARGAERRRLAAVKSVVEESHARHAHVSRVVPWNVPPARVHRVMI